MESRIERLETSFRDPAGFLYKNNGVLYRFVSNTYEQHYKAAVNSGLFRQLIDSGLLIAFEEITENHSHRKDWLKTLKPEIISPEILPSEWSFRQLKDAALITLHICKEALQKGCILKDATPQNIRFHRGKPVLIDHLSFELYADGKSWQAYRQFCETMLYPLLLNHYCGMEVHRTMQAWPTGVPAKSVIQLLPLRSRFSLNVYLHTFLAAGIGTNKINNASKTNKPQLSKNKILQILNSLEQLVQKLHTADAESNWKNYYQYSILSKEYLDAKVDIVSKYANFFSSAWVLDAGCNGGAFSFLFPESNTIVAADADAACISNLYELCKKQKRDNIYPAVIDLMNPTPATGWHHAETTAFWHRYQYDVILALALIHHLCIAQNLQFAQLAQTLSAHCRFLLIEFVPKSDPKTKQLLEARKDIFDNYTQHHFEEAFHTYFSWEAPVLIPHSERYLYFMIKKQ